MHRDKKVQCPTQHAGRGVIPGLLLRPVDTQSPTMEGTAPALVIGVTPQPPSILTTENRILVAHSLLGSRQGVSLHGESPSLASPSRGLLWSLRDPMTEHLGARGLSRPSGCSLMLAKGLSGAADTRNRLLVAGSSSLDMSKTQVLGGPMSLTASMIPDPSPLTSGKVSDACAVISLGTDDDDKEFEDLWNISATIPDYDLHLAETDLGPSRAARGTEFCQCLPDLEEQINEKKLALINAVGCSLVESPKFGDSDDSTRQALQRLAEEVTEADPEFLLKVALYTRQELNIRSTANFLLALAAWILASRPHFRRYFCAAVQLPSDWLQIPKFYQSLAGPGAKAFALPSCLRRAMEDKFRQFDEYQLAKYNTRKQRCKHTNRKRLAPEQLQLRNQMLKSRFFRSLQDQKLNEQPRSSTTQQEQKSGPKQELFNMKKLIQRLHITKPVNHVMALLGCRYPSDLASFSRSGLPGPWDSRLSGKRMKLKQPETWERELSLRGNVPAVWQELIDHRKLPFMAMLRNLRNMIRAGISQQHHDKVIARLSDKESVIRSRQFPFRFLSAYKVILDLEAASKRPHNAMPTNVQILEKIFQKNFLNSDGVYRVLRNSQRRDSRWRRAAMSIPAVYRLVQKTKKKLRSPCVPDVLMHRYRQALEAAIHISAQHNIPPLPGRTLIFCCVDAIMKDPCKKAKDLCCPGALGEGTSGQNTPITVLEVALLLALMVQGASEHARLVLYSRSACEEASVDPKSILGSVGTLLQQIERDNVKWNSDKAVRYHPLTQYLQELVSHKEQVDTFLMLSLYPPETTFTSALCLYRQRINSSGLFVNILPEAPSSKDIVLVLSQHKNDVTLCGFNEQVLKFIAERGGARLLQHVEKIDELYRIPKDEGALRKARTVDSLSHPGAFVPKLRWRSVRIFISSTFRDMHGERDILIRYVFPALRARAAQHFLSLEEIDLRWGVTEEDTRGNRQLSLCLSEVSRCQLFLGILGERYGYIPDEYSVPDVAEHRWLSTYPKGRSVTELEIVQFQKQDSSIDPPRAFFYLRDPAFIGSLSDRWRRDFVAESPDSESKMTELKSRVAELTEATCRRYSCQWGGVADGKAFVKGLDEFGTMVHEDIWGAIEKNFIKEQPEEEEEDTIQEAYQEYQQRQFCARKKQLLSLDDGERRPGKAQEGRMFLVSGGPSEGKTVFMAALAHKLRCVDQAGKSPQDPAPSCNVIFHFVDAQPDASNVVLMLTRICGLLSKHLKREGEVSRTYRGLVHEFESLLRLVSQSLRGRQTLTLLVDGADRLCGENGEPNSDWIPEFLPQRVQLVLSLDEGSSLQCSLTRRRDVSTLLLGPLEPSDRAEIVRQALAIYGKKLEESAFNNQMRLLLIKKGSQKPLYLKLASEDLRAFAVYEKVSGRIQSFPATLPPLLQHILGSLEQEHGAETVMLALSALLLSRTGLRERDLYAMLNVQVELASRPRPLTWEETLRAMERQEAVLPMAAFSYLLRSFQCMLGLRAPSHASDPQLQLSGSLLRDAVEQRYLRRPGLGAEVHLFLATYFWRSCDPQRKDPSRNPDAESLCALPYHLVHCGHKELLGVLLTDLRFLSLHTELSQLPRLCKVYSLYSASIADDADGEGSPPPAPDVEVYREFAQRNVTFLSRHPFLFLQQVLNEPEASPICQQAQKLLGKDSDGGLLKAGRGLRLMKWLNKPETLTKVNSKVMPIPSTPSCVGVSPSGRTAAVGTSEGSLHLLDLESGQEVRSLATSCDGISTCVFLSEGSLCTTSFDGKLEMWNTQDGCRLFLIEAHQRDITSCARSPDGKLLVSVSLDHHLKVWDSSRGTLVGSWVSSLPLNCVTFHPEGQLVAVGSWDKLIYVLKSLTWESVSILSGQSSTVRDLSFSPAGNVLASATLAGEVRLWAWREKVLLAAFQAHCGAAEVVRFIGHGQYLVTAGEDHKVQVWSGHLGQMRRSYGSKCKSPALSASVSPEGSSLAIGHQSESVKIYRLKDGFLTAECDVADAAVLSLLWLQKDFLATGGSDKTVCLWEVSVHKARRWGVCEGHEGAVLSLAYSNGVLASASDDCSVLLWSLPLPLSDQTEGPRSPLAALRGHTAGVTCCAFSPDGRYLATGSKDRSLLSWDVSASPPCLMREMVACHRDWVTGCAWMAASQLLSCSSDCTVCLWDPLTGQHLREFLGHKSAVSSVLAVGDQVVSASRDGVLKVWNQDGVELTSIPAHCSQINQCISACTPGRSESDLQVITAGADGSCKLWSPLLVEQVATLTGHSAGVCAAAAAWDVPSFLTVARDCTLRLWPLPPYEGGCIARQHRGAVTAVAWSPDGELAVSASDWGDMVVWSEARASDTVQVSKCAVRAVLFTSPCSFLVASDDLKVYQWDLDYLHRPRQRYSLNINSLVTDIGLAPTFCAMLGTVWGDLLILHPEKGHLQSVSCSLGYQSEVFYSQVTARAGDQMCLLENSQNPALHLIRMTEAGDLKAGVLVDLGSWKATERLHRITQAHPEFGLADSGGRLWVETRRVAKRDFDRDEWDVEFVTRKKKKVKHTEKSSDLSVLEVQSWETKQIHSDVITALQVLDDLIITASLDGDVKLWDRQSLKQVGLFHCDGSVSCLQPSPRSSSEIMCGDTLGNVYFLTSP
ncbi:telomerase protein component 1 isoform X2 [Microcaecilia unicolor]|uniref:Telomerase protein component 1 isoform X2 n=1 Tax=Microcaecilia unicolor TaxID=1415580 RepID=A0A6P7WTZ1_9AMPH|nr:telomerase protein component 1 isoform X2 [Microcaecilia unicolor]